MFFYAQLELASRTLRYVNAGHNPPFLVRRSGSDVEITALSAGGTVLGLFPDMPFEEAAVPLGPGDVLVAFTDGVTEALNAEGEGVTGKSGSRWCCRRRPQALRISWLASSQTLSGNGLGPPSSTTTSRSSSSPWTRCRLKPARVFHRPALSGNDRVRILT